MNALNPVKYHKVPSFSVIRRHKRPAAADATNIKGKQILHCNSEPYSLQNKIPIPTAYY